MNHVTSIPAANTNDPGSGNAKTLSVKERCIAGALGGIAPVVVMVVSSDARTMLSQVDWLVVAGYAFKSVFLMLLGGGVAWLYKSETNLWKVFQLGIVALALLAGAITGSQVQPAPNLPTVPVNPQVHYQPPQPAPGSADAVHTGPGSQHDSASLNFFILDADAAPISPLPHLKPIEIVAQSGAAKFAQGIFGQSNNYYLLIGVYANQAQAQSMANQINSDPRLPAGFNVYYYTNSKIIFKRDGISLVVGPNLSPSQAQTYVAAAAQVGLGPYVTGQM